MSDLVVPLSDASKRAILRSLRRDLASRARWLDGKTCRPYETTVKTKDFWVVGRVSQVRCIPVHSPCLLLDVAR